MITIVKMLEKKLNGCQTITTLLLTFFFSVCLNREGHWGCFLSQSASFL